MRVSVIDETRGHRPCLIGIIGSKRVAGKKNASVRGGSFEVVKQGGKEEQQTLRNTLILQMNF